MKLVLIFGPQAVGKMTVGQALEKRTDLKLFHNHMTIELLQPYFGFSSEMWQLSTLFRNEIFDAFARSDQYGMIFTYVWALDQKKDWEAVQNMCEIFESQGADVYFVELEADLNERLKRNQTPNRLAEKPSKRDVAASRAHLLETLENYRLNSLEGEIKRDNYIRINNTELSPDEVAGLIKEKFQFN
ncbi:MAG TPA: AAA family ATPase [Candidatus Angelobacter sp.]|nr:AAA family ATPase [Candidatus Angelobacter sp.]